MCNRSIDLIYFFSTFQWQVRKSGPGNDLLIHSHNPKFSTRKQNIAIYLSESELLFGFFLTFNPQPKIKQKKDQQPITWRWQHDTLLPDVPSALLVVTTANADSPPHDLNPSAMESRGPLSGRTPSSGQPPPAIRLRSTGGGSASETAWGCSSCSTRRAICGACAAGRRGGCSSRGVV